MKNTARPNVNDNFDNTEIDIDSPAINNENGWIPIDLEKITDQLSDAVAANDSDHKQKCFKSSITDLKANNDDPIMKRCIEELIDKREHWENNEYFRSNQKLYEILTNAMELFCTLNGTSTNHKVLRMSFDRVAKDMGYSFSQSKHYTYRVVNVVFGKNVEPKRIASYARVLKCALEKGIEPAGLTPYITRCGGIGKVRPEKKEKENEMTRCEKGKAILFRKPLTFIKNDSLSGEFKMRDYVDGVLLFATYDESKNGFNVLALIEKQSLINTAFESMASSVTDQEIAKMKSFNSSEKDDASAS